MSQVAPPPWDLTGSGYIFLYRFDRDFVMEHGLLPDHLHSAYRGGIGSVMLVDYRTSPVGPYRELLFIPGQVQRGRRRYYVITKIYVSSEASVVNGQENWGIPKELANFEVETLDERTRSFVASLNGNPFFAASVESGILRAPFNSWFNPFPARLLQQRDRDGQYLSTTPFAGGVVGLTASLKSLTVDSGYFPDVTQAEPLGVIEAVNFRMAFPVPVEVK